MFVRALECQTWAIQVGTPCSQRDGGLDANEDGRIPPEFWGILYAEYGIMVYPSAVTEQIDLHGLNRDKTFTDCYQGHIGKSSASPSFCKHPNVVQLCSEDLTRATHLRAHLNTCDNRPQSTRNTTPGQTHQIQGQATIAWRRAAISARPEQAGRGVCFWRKKDMVGMIVHDGRTKR